MNDQRDDFPLRRSTLVKLIVLVVAGIFASLIIKALLGGHL